MHRKPWDSWPSQGTGFKKGPGSCRNGLTSLGHEMPWLCVPGVSLLLPVCRLVRHFLLSDEGGMLILAGGSWLPWTLVAPPEWSFLWREAVLGRVHLASIFRNLGCK